MRSLRQLAVSGLSNPLHNPTRYLTRKMVRRQVGEEHRRVSNWNLTITNPIRMPDTLAIVGFVGLFEKVCERIHGGEWEEGTRRCGALEALKAWCEVRTGKTPGPSDVAEERRRPCRAQWGQDL